MFTQTAQLGMNYFVYSFFQGPNFVQLLSAKIVVLLRRSIGVTWTGRVTRKFYHFFAQTVHTIGGPCSSEMHVKQLIYWMLRLPVTTVVVLATFARSPITRVCIV